jgi:hypothetical protein
MVLPNERPKMVATAISFETRVTSSNIRENIVGTLSPIQWRVEAGFRRPSRFIAATPYAAIQAQALYKAGLAFAARAATDTRTEAGARCDHAMALDATWLHCCAAATNPHRNRIAAALRCPALTTLISKTERTQFMAAIGLTKLAESTGIGQPLNIGSQSTM